MKRCWACGCDKALSEFGTDKSRFDGKNPRCKPCIRAASAASVARNPEQRKANLTKYREANAEKCKAAVHRWYHMDKAHGRAVRQAYAEKDREQTRANKAKWRAENPEKTRAIKASRRTAPGSFSGADVKALIAAQSGRCVYCPAPLADGYHIDHVMPLALGGSNDATNIQLLCPPCNLSKGAKHPAVFAQERSALLNS